MNRSPQPTLRPLAFLRTGVICCFFVVGALTLPAPAHAAVEANVAQTTAPTAATTTTSLFALDLQVLGNRTRMIQVTFIVVAIGIGFLLWGKSK